MLKNPSVPVDVILPHVTYQDVGAAIDWLTKAFGFAEHYRYGNPEKPDGAQMHRGEAWIMLNSAREGRISPGSCGCSTQSLTVFVEDVDGHFLHARAAGARIVEEPHETMYGERQYAAVDLEGHHWLFSQHVRSVKPEEWGAAVKR